MPNKSQESDDQKNIAEQFAGVEMETLIGAPLMAATAGQQKLATEIYEFLKQVNSPKSDQKK